jgi:hypothetical protein
MLVGRLRLVRAAVLTHSSHDKREEAMKKHHPGGTSEGDLRHKKTYAKPEIRQVSLRPEEAVLGACKSSSVAAGPGGTCAQGGGNCFAVAS